jgi:hypothetical protein
MQAMAKAVTALCLQAPLVTVSRLIDRSLVKLLILVSWFWLFALPMGYPN